MTEASYDFWKMIKAEGAVFTETLFKNIEEDEIAVVRRVIEKMLLILMKWIKKMKELSKSNHIKGWRTYYAHILFEL